jgi:hypothetical protein
LTKETSLVTRKIVTILLLSSGLALAGCASKPKELPPQPTGTTGTTTTNPPPPQQPMGPMPGSTPRAPAACSGRLAGWLCMGRVALAERAAEPLNPWWLGATRGHGVDAGAAQERADRLRRQDRPRRGRG